MKVNLSNNKNKKENRKLTAGMIFVLVISFILTSAIVTGLVIALKKSDDEPVAAVFKGVKITKSEYTIFRYNSAIKLTSEIELPEDATEEEVKKMVRDYINGNDGGRSFWENVDKDALENVKKYAIRMLEAGQRNITLNQDEILAIEAQCDSMALQYDNPDDYFLKNFGITRDQYVNMSINMKKLDKLMNRYIEDQKYTRSALEAYYNENKDLFQTWSVRHIYISTVDFGEEDGPVPQDKEELEKKKQLANELLERIKNGEDMEKLVKEYSDDPYKDLDKGLFEIKADSDYLFKDWVVKSKTGDAEIFETDYGYSILKCEKSPSYEDVKEEVRRAYGIQDYNDYLDNLLKNDTAEPRIYQKVINKIDMRFFTENFN